MEVIFGDDSLRRLEAGEGGDGGHSPGVVKAFRKRMQVIRSARDERDFYALRSLRFEKLKANREGQYSMRLNDQWRLILSFDGEGSGKKVLIVEITDYH